MLNTKAIKALFALILTAGALFSPTGCAKRQSNVESGIAQQILHKGNQTEPQELDPHILTGLPEYKILIGLFEGLVTLDPKDLSPAPGVAKSWEVSADGTQYTFNLRDDAKWSNGDPVTAQDFIFTMKRVLSRKLACPYANSLYSIVNAKQYHKEEITDFAQVGISAPNAHTLIIKHKHPVPYFLTMLNSFPFMPVHMNTILKHGAIDERGTQWTRPANMISNGPFKLKSWEISKVITLERNTHYWDNDAVKLNKIHLYPIDDINTEERAFRTGQLHITERVPLPRIKKLQDENSPFLRLSDFFSTYAYVFNTTKPPFNDPRVRKAFSLAVDRQSIVDNVSKRGENPALSFTPPGVAGYTASTTLEANVEEARKLLAEAGYPNGEEFPDLTLLYNTSESHKSIAEALQHMIYVALKVNIELVNQEWKVYLKSRYSNEHNLIRFAWVGDHLDPSDFLNLFHSNAPNNLSGWKNLEYDKLLDQAATTQNQTARNKIFDQAEHILIDELPVLPLHYSNTAYLVHTSVKGWHPNILDMHTYKHVYLEDSETK